MKRILILANSSGGLYDFRNAFLLRLLQHYEVAASLPDTVKTSLLENEGVKVFHTPINRRGVNPREDIKLLRDYRRLLRSWKPDLVLTYTIKPNVYGGFVCARLGIPYIATVTGLGSAFEKQGMLLRLVEFLYRRGLKKASCVFFQNAENLALFQRERLVSGKTRLVSGSGVDLTTWQPMEYPCHDEVNFMYVGRVMREKGIRELLEAAEALHSDKVRFTLAGYCDEDWQQVLDEKEKEGVITQLGFHPDMRELYRDCSAVVMPTYHEGMSNVLMEASACARPVLASGISGCREIVDSGVTGFTFEAQSASSLTEALKRFLSLTVSERAAMGRRGRAKMEREFDRTKVAEAYLEEVQASVGDQSEPGS